VTHRRIVLDDVFLSLAKSGVARVWTEMLGNVVKRDLLADIDAELVILNRSDELTDMGLPYVDFPDYDFTQTAHDRMLLSRFVADLGADLFTSTYYTFVPDLPSVMVVYDLIPEVMGFDKESRAWLERRLAILHASRYVTISESTKKDLMRFFPSSGTRTSSLRRLRRTPGSSDHVPTRRSRSSGGHASSQTTTG
jgi:hypothetical protein